MAARRGPWPYRQIGVLLPLERYDPSPNGNPNNQVMREANVRRTDLAMGDRFLLVQCKQIGKEKRTDSDGPSTLGKAILMVQSASTGELFYSKILERSYDPDTQQPSPPLELRASTYDDRIGDATVDTIPLVDPQRKGTLPNMPCSNKLCFCQPLDLEGRPNFNVYSLFF
jgi:hypothetical protein